MAPSHYEIEKVFKKVVEMKTIYKYELRMDDTASIKMPEGAKILCVKTQNGNPCIWALVDTEVQGEYRSFVIFGTGHDVENEGEYIGTFLIDSDSLVFHVFEVQS